MTGRWCLCPVRGREALRANLTWNGRWTRSWFGRKQRAESWRTSILICTTLSSARRWGSCGGECRSSASMDAHLSLKKKPNSWFLRSGFHWQIIIFMWQTSDNMMSDKVRLLPHVQYKFNNKQIIGRELLLCAHWWFTNLSIAGICYIKVWKYLQSVYKWIK